mmetsp:Transcript_15429/g.19578  ORF Transcript_15429/g.19578 Transcript_15429/m.19578 type:complete len:223 (-) Transcript_15429:56-724(-)|eukprot:CAMPEP_0203663266 /NCGR_PEP_ID=MMETSP0090-20130426/915_1 /ASSEMBLY_ACC=CAM_ASM_001088 /TAXON_ID=426623 /ORGANISM="Chaetoceros affinis, Strain CCMP159" /LENGTH=222 /DNA_ID=CAMNT_0050526151 /DNA_START=41 /DNA_END=709 /DNA_ORIENTATION=+
MVNNKKENKKSTTSAMEALLGSDLNTSVGNNASTSAVMKGKDLVLLYFSASWCPPCRNFTPKLAEFYTQVCTTNGVEIVYISSDQDEASFNEYFGKMPWASLPVFGSSAIKQKLADSLKISGLPTLVVLDVNTGFFISDNARFDVAGVCGNEENSKSLIESWKSTEAVPIEEATLSGTGPDGIFVKIFKTIISNPMYMVALIFMGKKLLKKLEELGSVEDEL